MDHAIAPSNFGADIMRGSGDLPGSDVYHADLTCDFGIQYVWRGRVTSVIGQDVPRRLSGIYDFAHPIASAKTLAKEAIKGVAGTAESREICDPRAESHPARCDAARRAARAGVLSQQSVLGRRREGRHGRGGRGDSDRSDARHVDRARRDVHFLYAPGENSAGEEPFEAPTRAAFERVAQRYEAGRLLVVTTRRLLGMRRAVCEARVAETRDASGLHLDVRLPVQNDAAGRLALGDLDGLTIYVDDPQRTRVSVEGREVVNLVRNAADHTGRGSVSLPLARLEFPAL